MIPVFPIDCGKEGCDKALEQTSAQASTLLSVISVALDDLSFTLEAQAKLVASVQRSALNVLKRRLNVQFDKVTEVTDFLGTLLENRLTEQQVMLNYAAPGISELTEFGSSESTWQATAAAGTANLSAVKPVPTQPQASAAQESTNDYGAGGADSAERGEQSATTGATGAGAGAAGNGTGGYRPQAEPTAQTAEATGQSEARQTRQVEVTPQPFTPQAQPLQCSPAGPLVPVVVMAQLTAVQLHRLAEPEGSYSDLIPDPDDDFDYPDEDM